MDDARQRLNEDGQAPKVSKPRPRPEDRELPEGRLRKELAKKKRCCANCVYATRPCGRWFRLVLAQFSGLLICANSAEAPGELRGLSPSNACPNFRAKRPPTVQAGPPPSPPADGSFFYIPLTQGEHAMVDAEDCERVRRYKWCLSRVGNQLYAYRKHHGKTLRMHQFIMNPPKGLVVDHIDGNGLNTRCHIPRSIFTTPLFTIAYERSKNLSVSKYNLYYNQHAMYDPVALYRCSIVAVEGIGHDRTGSQEKDPC